MSIPFIKYSKLMLAVSGLIVVLSLAALVKWRLHLGIDFTGGSLVEFSFEKNRPSVEEIQQSLQVIGVKQAVIQPSEMTKMLVRTGFLTEEQHQALVKGVQKDFQDKSGKVIEDRFETIGGSVSQQLRRRALWAIVFVNLGIIAYVAYAFRRVSRPVASWKYGALAIVALIHDVLLVIGVFVLLGAYRGVEVDIGFVVALLTVLGYSVNDTIVVFDRVREHLLHRSVEDFAGLVNKGLNDTLMRSLNTTLTTLLPLFALYFFGGASIKNFALALLIGIASGAYSSIFIASPLLVMVERWQRRVRS